MSKKQDLALAASLVGLGLTVVRELRQQRSEKMRVEKHEMAKERHAKSQSKK